MLYDPDMMLPDVDMDDMVDVLHGDDLRDMGVAYRFNDGEE